MIDTDRYEGLTMNDMEHLELWELSRKLLAEVKRLREVVDKQQMQYLSLETAYYNSPSQIEIKREIDIGVKRVSGEVTKYMKEKNKRLREEVKMLWQYVDTEQMHNDGLLTVEGEMKND